MIHSSIRYQTQAHPQKWLSPCKGPVNGPCPNLLWFFVRRSTGEGEIWRQCLGIFPAPGRPIKGHTSQGPPSGWSQESFILFPPLWAALTRLKNAEVVCRQPGRAGELYGSTSRWGSHKGLLQPMLQSSQSCSGERGEPWAPCNDQHIPRLSGIPTVKSPAACTDLQPRNTWTSFVWGWGPKHQYHRFLLWHPDS